MPFLGSLSCQLKTWEKKRLGFHFEEVGGEGKQLQFKMSSFYFFPSSLSSLGAKLSFTKKTTCDFCLKQDPSKLMLPPLMEPLLELEPMILNVTVFKKLSGDFPGSAVVKNPPANAGDMGSSPGPGISHMPRSN